MGLFKKNKWKENQADKIKKQPSGNFSKKLSRSDLELIKNSSYSNRDILKASDGGVVGSTLQIQNVSTMIIMCRKSVELDMDAIKSYGIDIINYDDGRDVYYVCGTYNQLYCYTLWQYIHTTPDKLALFISGIFNSNVCSDMDIFTDEEVNTLSLNRDGTIIDIDYDRMTDMQSQMDKCDLDSHELTILLCDKYEDEIKKNIITFADYCMYGSDKVLAFVKKSKLSLVQAVFHNNGIEYDMIDSDEDIIKQHESYEDEVAMEIIED